MHEKDDEFNKINDAFETLEGELYFPEAHLALQALRGLITAQRDEIEALNIHIGELEDLALTDSLTGLGNRRAYDQAIEEWAYELNNTDQLRHGDIERRRHGLLILGDLDNFKVINDVLGYEHGDSVLAYISSLLQESIRHDDAVYRIGGDEFALLVPVIPGQELAAYSTITQRFHQNLEELRKVHTTNPYDNQQLSAIDIEAIRAVGMSFAPGVFSVSLSQKEIAGIVQETMREVKRTKERKGEGIR